MIHLALDDDRPVEGWDVRGDGTPADVFRALRLVEAHQTKIRTARGPIMTRERLTGAEIFAKVPAPRARGARSLRTEPHAATARYDRTTRTFVVMLTSDAGVVVPVDQVPWLAVATDARLSTVEVSPVGVGLSWPALDVDFTVAGIVRRVFDRRTLARAVGATGGATRTVAKAEAAP